MSNRRKMFKVVATVAGGLIVVITYFPIIFVVSNSLKSGQAIYSGDVFNLFTQFNYGNYVAAWEGVDEPLFNTVIVGVVAITIALFAAVLGGYAFSQLQFRGKGVLFTCYISLLMIPWTLTLIPLFLTVRSLHMYNSWWGLILPYAAGAQPVLVMLFRGVFEQIPKELYQSARVDGCSERQVLMRVVAPLSRPILLTGVVLMSISIWGDYIWPEIVIQNNTRYTISAGIQYFVNLQGGDISGAGAVFAAYVVATLPLFILMLLTMRYFVNGITEGALKL